MTEEEKQAQSNEREKKGNPSGGQASHLWVMAEGSAAITIAARRQAERQAREAAITTPVAKPAPAAPPLISRRVFVLGGFWSLLALVVLGIIGPSLDFLWRRGVTGFGGPIPVSKEQIPPPGADPFRIVEGRFWLVNLEPGITPHGEETAGGLLALWQKCPHLGCTVPYRPDFTFEGRKGWFRCPCHGSTYTKEGGVRVFGPAPRSLDVFPLEVKEDGSIVVETGPAKAEKGGGDNPSRAVPYNV